jgi:glycerol-3-phosphate dehydrogenase
VLATAGPDERTLIAGTPYLWAEVRWAARAEAVVHLDDLMLRRLRLGLLLPDGGAELLERVGTICREELRWDAARWAAEREAYLEMRHARYGLPDPATIPDWRRLLAEAVGTRAERRRRRRRLVLRGGVALAGAGAAALGLAVARRLRSGSR